MYLLYQEKTIKQIKLALNAYFDVRLQFENNDSQFLLKSFSRCIILGVKLRFEYHELSKFHDKHNS